MSRMMDKVKGSQPQRGFWLRCFLGGVIGTALILASPVGFSSPIDIPGPEHLTHVDGLVVNTAGHAVADVEVMLVRDDKVTFQTRTNKSGEFNFEHVSGRYTFRVARSEYAPAAREIVVTDEIVTRVERKKLYVIVGPGACMDECSAVVTSKREFERDIREKQKH
ncbi:MAG TPA: carboxypeptidase-like regulatory domain-containing protein [Terracidiphilus sp.]